MSSPSASLLLAMAVSPPLWTSAAVGRRLHRTRCHQEIPSSRSPRAQPCRAVVAGKEFSALLDAETERDEDLALGLHPAVVAGLDPVDGRLGDAGLAGQLRLRHQRCFPEPLNSIHAAPPRAVIHP